ncbi:MAG: type II toxin-antitoxin system RelE/ParE family toxin [Candidatus Pacebacteria bacterium]|nr:type II toxin-antitoxin system RelE/ParE family toxin [Candidatus Paceibacterota bacterium]PIR61095.1 MAG: type II toxin-antitoxin system mRNA interferase toxin, RelE/StbE family [Candidatus Pacebacteria bacterium CG10_big_fil_rev_8_21_14_0_10_45_6]
MYGIQFTRSAKKSFSKIAKQEQVRIAKAIEKLAVDPTIGKPLQGVLKNHWSLRIGSYRVIYVIFKERLLVIVFDVGHRREVYKER